MLSHVYTVIILELLLQKRILGSGLSNALSTNVFQGSECLTLPISGLWKYVQEKKGSL